MNNATRLSRNRLLLLEDAWTLSVMTCNRCKGNKMIHSKIMRKCFSCLLFFPYVLSVYTIYVRYRCVVSAHMRLVESCHSLLCGVECQTRLMTLRSREKEVAQPCAPAKTVLQPFIYGKTLLDHSPLSQRGTKSHI